MVIITKVEVQKNNKDKVNIYLDDEYYCGMHMDTCIKYGLSKGKEIEKKCLDNILLESEKNIAFNNTAKYINRGLKTTKQVEDYLLKKGYSKTTIDYVVEKLKEYKYIDDEYYAKSYISLNKAKYGKYKLLCNLLSKGIEKCIAETFLKEIDNCENLVYTVSIKYLSKKERTPQNYTRLSRFLLGRGFSFEDVNSVLNKLRQEDKQEE